MVNPRTPSSTVLLQGKGVFDLVRRKQAIVKPSYIHFQLYCEKCEDVIIVRFPQDLVLTTFDKEICGLHVSECSR